LDIANLVGVKLGNFRLEQLLGRGRMGVVYLARDEALLRPTAVKILSWASPERQGLDPEAWFLAEARNVARINHPHVVQIYGVAKHIPHCYIAMEYVGGTSAEAWVAEHGPFSPLRATEILLQTASALQAAHDAGVVHRDVKPGNVLLTAEGTAKLGDFGMAVSAQGNPSSTTLRAGTPHYTAPEIWRGQFASAATDIYALGATFFHLLTGRPPFECTTLEELMAAHLDTPVPDLRELIPDIPAACNQLIHHAMAKSPQDRYRSAQTLSWEVRGLVRELNSLVPGSAAVRRSDPESLQPASGRGLVNDFFGFVVRPFQWIDPVSAPGLGEPFRSMQRALWEALNDSSAHTVFLNGERGSGKTTLAQQLVAKYEPSALVASLCNDEPNKPLQQQVSRAFGMVPAPSSKPNGELDGLLNELERAQVSRPNVALLVLDNVSASPARLSELAVLMQAASKTKAFRMLVIASPELQERWSRAGKRDEELGLRQLFMPPLTPRQTLEYMADWLHCALQPHPHRVMVTPDAGLLVAHRSGGNLARINRIAQRMLEAASSERRSVLCSWDAWMAPADTLYPLPQLKQTRPFAWPGRDVLEVLNAERQNAGIAPRRFRPVAESGETL
jgi:serine/threonine protein kinase